MTDKLIDSIYEVTKNYRDPVTNLYLDPANKNINIVFKEGKVNISLNIDSRFKEKYQDLIIDLKNGFLLKFLILRKFAIYIH